MNLKFHPIADNRQFITLDLEEPTSLMALPPGPLGAVYRVRYTVSEEDARKVDQSEIRRELLSFGASKVVIQPRVERAVRARVAEMRDDLSEVAAMELWIGSQGLVGAEAESLRVAHSEYVARLSA